MGHYSAVDSGRRDVGDTWGEHEIDHLLLYQLAPDEHLTIRPCADEVGAIAWMTREELLNAVRGGKHAVSEMSLWTPWFRIIAEQFLEDWWDDLSVTMDTDKYVVLDTIFRF